jgi:Glycosyl hydrolase family 99
MKKLLTLLLFGAGCVATAQPAPSVPAAAGSGSAYSNAATDVLTFYFTWFSGANGKYYKWASNKHQPGQDDISSSYFPELGVYDSSAPGVIEQQLDWMKRAGIGIVMVSWWGRDAAPTPMPLRQIDRLMPKVLNEAQKRGLKVGIMRDDRCQTAGQFEADVTYLMANYMNHPAFWRIARPTAQAPHTTEARPVLLQWRLRGIGNQKGHAGFTVAQSGGCENLPDSIRTNAQLNAYWAGAYDRIRARHEVIIIPNTGPTRAADLRQTRADGLFIWGVDGFDQTDDGHPGRIDYAPFVNAVRADGGLAIVATSPGFHNQRHQPNPNLQKYTPRTNPSVPTTDPAHYTRFDPQTGEDAYTNSWASAKAANPDFIDITSFNTWNESHQIEPARPHQIGTGTSAGFTYEAYTGAFGERDPARARYVYLDKTKEYSAGWRGYRPSNYAIIQNVIVERVSPTDVQVRWQTDQPTTGWVAWGTDPAALTTQTPKQARSQPTTQHRVILTNVPADQPIFLRAWSDKDTANNPAPAFRASCSTVKRVDTPNKK